MAPKRIESIDVAKGIAILVICLRHLANAVGGPLMSTLFPYLIGTFFIFAGYFYKPGSSYLNNVTKRFKTVLVPFVLYTFIVLFGYWLFRLAVGNPIDFGMVATDFKSMMLDRYAFKPFKSDFAPNTSTDSISRYAAPAWFLPRLFCAELIVFAIADWALKAHRNMIYSIAGLLSISAVLNLVLPFHLPLQFENWFAMAAMELVGTWARQEHVGEYLESAYKTSKYWLVAGVVLTFYVLIVQLGCTGNDLVSGVYGPWIGWSIYLWLPTSVAGTYLLMVTCNLVNKVRPAGKLFQVLGQHTLFILCFHQVVAQVIGKLLGLPVVWGDMGSTSILGAVVLTLVSVLLCTALDLSISAAQKFTSNTAGITE